MFRASLHSRNTYGHFTRDHFAWQFAGKNTGAPPRAQHFVRACAVETHMDISQGPCGMKIDEENAGRPGDPRLNTEHRALAVT